MKIYDVLPPASPRHGFLKTVTGWRDAALVEFGPEGTMHYAQSSIPGEYDNLFTTGMEESQIIFGDTDNLERCILEVDRNRKPNLLFVTSSPVSEIIGADLRYVCVRLEQQVSARLRVWDQIPMDGDEAVGSAAAFRLAGEYLSGLEPQAERQGFLILGLDQTDHNGLSDFHELRRMVETYFDLPCRNDSLGRYALGDIPGTRLLLAVTREAAELAKAAERLWGIPWCSVMPYGMEACEKMVADMGEALGRQPGPGWQEDLQAARRARYRFSFAVRPRTLPEARICLPAEQAEAVRQLLEALGVRGRTVPAGEWYQKPENTDLLLIGSGVLCDLYPENRSLCMAEPAISRLQFGEYCAMMGIRGEGNLLTALYPRLLPR